MATSFFDQGNHAKAADKTQKKTQRFRVRAASPTRRRRPLSVTGGAPRRTTHTAIITENSLNTHSTRPPRARLPPLNERHDVVGTYTHCKHQSSQYAEGPRRGARACLRSTSFRAGLSLSADVTDDVAAWLANPADNQGWAFISLMNDMTPSSWGFVTSMNDKPAEHPKLVVVAANCP